MAFADGIDTRVHVNGGPAGSPSCGSVQVTADSDGGFSSDCQNMASNDITSITFAVLATSTQTASDPQGGLTCQSDLSSVGWGESSSSANGIDSCTFTAPKQNFVTNFFNDVASDGDCDLDDFILGIPSGCDVKFTNDLNGNLSPMVPGTNADLAVNGAPLAPLPTPEPGELSLLATGCLGLFFFRRKFNTGACSPSVTRI
ncbi:MAG: PEP-CTERM sorting domain-containing protein [Candidatus Acidiferrales bacterium]